MMYSMQTLVPDHVSSLNFSSHRGTFMPLNPNPNHHLPRKKPRYEPPDLPKGPSLTQVDSSHDVRSPLLVVRTMVAGCLLDREPFTPIDLSLLLRKFESNHQVVTEAEKAALRDVATVEKVLRSMAEDNGSVELEEFVMSGKRTVMVMNIDRSKLVKELSQSGDQCYQISESNSFKSNKPYAVDVIGNGFGFGMARPPLFLGVPMMTGPRGISVAPPHCPPFVPKTPMGGAFNGEVNYMSEGDGKKDVDAMLNNKTVKEKELEEILGILNHKTVKENLVAAKFKTNCCLKEYCSALTKEDCRQKIGFTACEKVHFRRIIGPHTDVSLGDCNFLDKCHHKRTCPYIHYELDTIPDTMMGSNLVKQQGKYCSEAELGLPQWINCDIRNFRMDILGQFEVIMADPPWDIYMELPYGTMSDEEMLSLNVPALQTDGLIFLWVTGRAMELGRDCLDHWGYKYVQDIIWVKTNQLQRINRTGRTGHWLNHSKEHCLVGIKGNPKLNANIDTDVIVSEVRETSRKPDEMYPMIERISPKTRKLELFARPDNTHAGWLSLGNQLDGVQLVDEGLRARFKAAYPGVKVRPPSPSN